MKFPRPLPTEKRCGKCGETKPLDQYSLSRKATETQREVYRSTCKTCQAEQARAWFHANKERAKDNRHAHAMRSTYGITPEQYQRMVDAQGGVCAICQKPETSVHGSGTQFRLAVDHCHSGGAVRGLLCQRCNRALGLFGDDVTLMEAAISYLERHRSVT